MKYNSTMCYGNEELVLNIDPTAETQARDNSQNYKSAAARDRAYINQLVLIQIVSWLQSDPEFPAIEEKVIPELLEEVNGIAITIENKRLILIPTEEYDTSELRVPQEWVDIPSLAGDYYVAMQVDLEESEVRVWGYAAHEQLMSEGTYTPRNRTYFLETAQLSLNPEALWISLELGLEVQTLAQLEPIPPLPKEQLNNLVVRLGNPELVFPRLQVPFLTWAALIESEEHRKKWFELRQGVAQQLRQRIPVLQYLQAGIDEVAQRLGWAYRGFTSDLAIAKSAAQQSKEDFLYRDLTIDGKRYELRIKPEKNPETNGILWSFSLHILTIGGKIPTGVILRLLTENGEAFEGNEAFGNDALEYLEIVLELEPGEGIIWEIEPQPENYQREILVF